MPINASYKKMLHSFGKTYGKGKTVCRKLSDGAEVCISEQAWSVFYAYLKEHGKDDTKALTMGADDVIVITPKIYASAKNTAKKIRKLKLEELSDEKLLYYHAKYHALSTKIGDTACKKHFKIASEMLNRGLGHVERSDCDIVVGLSSKIKEAFVEDDEEEVLKKKWKACKAMLFRLSQGVKFETGAFKGLELSEQKHMVKNFMRKLRRTMLARGLKPKKKKPCKK